MAVCNFPQTSPPIGQTSTSCLQRFTIHFRRPKKPFFKWQWDLMRKDKKSIKY